MSYVTYIYESPQPGLCKNDFNPLYYSSKWSMTHNCVLSFLRPSLFTYNNYGSELLTLCYPTRLRRLSTLRRRVLLPQETHAERETFTEITKIDI